MLDYAPALPGPTGWLLMHVPALDSLRQYSWRALGADLLAGLTVATVAVLQAMAYATLAGMPPEYGLVYRHCHDGRRGATRLITAAD